MVSAFTPNKRIEQPAHNDYIDSWDVPVNADWAIIDLALGSGVNLNLTGLSGNQTLTSAQYQPLKLIAAGAPTAATNLVVPSGVGGLWVVRNNTTGGFAITISSAAGGASVTVPAGTNTLVTCDGSATGMFLAINTPPAAAGATTQVQYNNSGVLAGSASLTWDGTTLLMSGLNNTGNTVLGDSPGGDTLTINGTGVSTPNGLVVNTNQLVLGGTPFNQVAIGTATPTAGVMLTVAGTIKSTAGGMIFPDGTQQITAFAATGAVVDFIGGVLPTGWVWANGTTIGNAASAATGRANADTVVLFTLLWNSWANAQAPVSGGRGASAAADYAANKTIAVPDLRGAATAGTTAMGGATDRGNLPGGATPGAYMGVNQTQVRVFGFVDVATSVSGGISGSCSVHVDGQIFGGGSAGAGSGAGSNFVAGSPVNFGADGGGSVSGSFPGGSFGGAGSIRNDGNNLTGTIPIIQPTFVMNKIIKL